MKILSDLKLAYQLTRHSNEIEFLGKCPCNHCDYWEIRFRGRVVHLKEDAYDKFRYVVAMRS